MGFFSGLGSLASSAVSAIGSFFGGGSSSDSGRDRGGYSSSSESYHTSKVTHYDPDKVKVAELENERVGLVKEAQLELIEFNAQMEAAMLEARCRGFHIMQQAMMGMLKEVNVLAEERLVLLEKGSLQQIQQVETMYADLKSDVQNDDFLQNKVPQLLNLASQFPEGTDMRQTFMKGIDQEMATHFSFKTNQLSKLNERCQVVVTSVVTSKERMQAHIDTVVTKRIEQLELVMQSNAKLEFKSPVLQLDSAKQTEVAKLEVRTN
jgi:hypothetical protein